MIEHPPFHDGADDAQSDDPNDPAEQTIPVRADPDLDQRLAEFERLYRSEFGSVAGYFARRTRDPQLVADLTADTFVAAMHSFGSFQGSQSSPRGWTLGLARRVWTRHREAAPWKAGHNRRRASMGRLLSSEELEELLWRIDLESSAAELLERLAPLSESDRDAIELIDIAGLTPAEAARELDMPLGTLHMRLLLARARLRRQGGEQ